MLYGLEQGGVEKRIIEQCMREHLPLPKKIANAPQLFFGLELYYGAFLDLSTCRSGLGDGPISWQYVHDYAIVNEFSEEQGENLHYFVMKMDAAFLNQRQKSNGKSK